MSDYFNENPFIYEESEYDLTFGYIKSPRRLQYYGKGVSPDRYTTGDLLKSWFKAHELAKSPIRILKNYAPIFNYSNLTDNIKSRREVLTPDKKSIEKIYAEPIKVNSTTGRDVLILNPSLNQILTYTTIQPSSEVNYSDSTELSYYTQRIINLITANLDNNFSFIENNPLNVLNSLYQPFYLLNNNVSNLFSADFVESKTNVVNITQQIDETKIIPQHYKSVLSNNVLNFENQEVYQSHSYLNSIGDSLIVNYGKTNEYVIKNVNLLTAYNLSTTSPQYSTYISGSMAASTNNTNLIENVNLLNSTYINSDNSVENYQTNMTHQAEFNKTDRIFINMKNLVNQANMSFTQSQLLQYFITNLEAQKLEYTITPTNSVSNYEQRTFKLGDQKFVVSTISQVNNINEKKNIDIKYNTFVKSQDIQHQNTLVSMSNTNMINAHYDNIINRTISSYYDYNNMTYFHNTPDSYNLNSYLSEQKTTNIKNTLQTLKHIVNSENLTVSDVYLESAINNIIAEINTFNNQLTQDDHQSLHYDVRTESNKFEVNYNMDKVDFVHNNSHQYSSTLDVLYMSQENSHLQNITYNDSVSNVRQEMTANTAETKIVQGDHITNKVNSIVDNIVNNKINQNITNNNSLNDFVTNIVHTHVQELIENKISKKEFNEKIEYISFQNQVNIQNVNKYITELLVQYNTYIQKQQNAKIKTYVSDQLNNFLHS